MSDERIHKSIAQRLDLRFPSRGLPKLWPARRWAMLVCALVPLGWLMAMSVAGRPAIYQARPVSLAHQFIANNCESCHTQHLQGLLRVATLSEHARSVNDSACQACHPQLASDHHQNLIASDAVRCTTCHREHVDRATLARVTDEACTACHQALRTTAGPSVHFVREIRDLASHPEFAALRPVRDGIPAGQAGALPGGAHGIYQRAKLAAVGSEQVWRDATPLRFNHAKHLVAGGVLVGINGQTGERQFEVLTCAKCHQPEAVGRTMRPITYQEHCAKCHKLEFSEKLQAGGPLPHARPEVVQAVVREKLTAYIAKHGELIESSKTEEEATASNLLRPRLPSKSQSAAPPTFADQQAWIQAQLTIGSPTALQLVMNGCAYCHEVAKSAPRINLAAFVVAPPHIPDRWLPHSQFDHGKHEVVSCTECHAAPTSQATSDILLPSMEVCRRCHEPPATWGLSPRNAARADCVECHGYHHAAPFAGKTLEELGR